MDLQSLLKSRREDIALSINWVFRDYGASPGASVVVIQGDRTVFAKSYGLANAEDKIPATTNTNYRLASLTKQFTAMAVMILAERKQLSLDDRLIDFFPDFPACGKPITVRHLLQHTSGLLDYEDLIPAGRMNQLKDRDVLDLLKQQDRILFLPGDRFRYSNSGYAMVALIVEKVSGLSFAEFLKRNIFDRLGMTNTVAHEEGVTVVANRAYGYSKQADGFTRTDQSLTSAVLGDGGIYSSVSDLAKWDAALIGDQIVSQAILRQAFVPGKLNNGGDTKYGFGWQLNTYRGLQCISHSGTTIGSATSSHGFRRSGSPSSCSRIDRVQSPARFWTKSSMCFRSPRSRLENNRQLFVALSGKNRSTRTKRCTPASTFNRPLCERRG